jgi:hypothetical protein
MFTAPGAARHQDGLKGHQSSLTLRRLNILHKTFRKFTCFKFKHFIMEASLLDILLSKEWCRMKK